MEAFSLLKYWRGATTTPIPTTTRSSTSSSDNEGPFFDLEFSLQETNQNTSNQNQTDEEEQEEEHEDEEEEEGGGGGGGGGEGGINLSISSSSSSYNSTHSSKENLQSDESVFINGENSTSLIVSSTDSAPKFRNNLFKSAKFRVLMALKLKKLKENGGEAEEKGETERKLLTVKFIKMEEAPMASLFSRDSSSKSENLKMNDEEEKRFTKDMMQKYIRMMKPLYVRASKRYGEKMSFSGGEKKGSALFSASPPSPATLPPCTAAEIGGGGNGSKGGGKNLTAGLRVVRKHLGKSKSASAVTAEAPPVSRRRDDSLIQQQDGIQSAIMHCKRSFNCSRESPVLQRSSSHQPAAVAAANSTAEQVE